MDYNARPDLQYRWSTDQNGNPVYHDYVPGLPSGPNNWPYWTPNLNVNQTYYRPESPIPPLSDKDRYEEAQRVWEEIFHQYAYTNFVQIEYLKDKAGVSWDDFLQNPRILSTRVTKDAILQDLSYDNVKTWARSLGRCTSFAVAVVRRLEEILPGCYDFKYYDLKGHRVARCARSGILIDSSSSKGAIDLGSARGEWFTFEDEYPRWKWMDELILLTAQKKTSKELTIQECMTIDTCEIKDNKRLEPLFYFRLFEHGQAEYRGMLKWNISERRLLLIRDMRTRDETKKMAADSVILFSQQGTMATEAECLSTLERFIRHQGPCGPAQWQANLGWQFNDEIWQAAKRVWGMPHLVTTGVVHYLTYNENWREQEEESTPTAKAKDHVGLFKLQEAHRHRRRSGGR